MIHRIPVVWEGPMDLTAIYVLAGSIFCLVCAVICGILLYRKVMASL